MHSTPAGLSRRDAVLALGGAGASLVLIGGPKQAAAQTFDCILTPEMTEGPYWVDEKLNRTLNGGYVAAVRADGAVLTGSVIAAPGNMIQIYGTGFGPTNPEIEPGVVFAGDYPLANDVTLTIGGMPVSVQYAGLVATGLYQLNVTVPQLAAGDHEVIASVMGASSPNGALLKIA